MQILLSPPLFYEINFCSKDCHDSTGRILQGHFPLRHCEASLEAVAIHNDEIERNISFLREDF
ncbi:hypothetical protein [Helicobacter sp.]|uniref:hypothetical protein n=1 Tax=Helicobacter sp. TaxID=218 RepID=UPI0019B2A037|nr:hypothetical protein [Helicobacter sp.]MBD5166021.1 hypothetical protein [Helicobacter sp.]